MQLFILVFKICAAIMLQGYTTAKKKMSSKGALSYLKFAKHLTLHLQGSAS